MEEFEYIKKYLTFIKSTVEVDNKLSLLDINKFSEDIFMHILNEVYSWNLKNANLLQENFPAIDLVDEKNHIVVQVTSTTSTEKLRSTIEKFQKLDILSGYQLKIFYIKDKPKFQKGSLSEFADNGVNSEDIIGIKDLLEAIQSEKELCHKVYQVIQQRTESLSFRFNINSYFSLAEPHLLDKTYDKFQKYDEKFISFIESDKKVLEVYAGGGNGKSHLLNYLSNIETKYVPLVFTKQVNIEEDLKKLSLGKKYLLIFDDIDRFLDTSLMYSLIAFTLSNENIKLIISYRIASKQSISAILRKYTDIKKEEIEIVWGEEEIDSLIQFLNPKLKENVRLQLLHNFNKNPYLITQAIKGNIETVKAFSQKIVDDTETALQVFELTPQKIKETLFVLSLVAPISDQKITEYISKEIIASLEDAKILRKLASKYRFNPDIQGDLYLANYIDENGQNFSDVIEELLPIFSETIFTNLSYALIYNKSPSLQEFIKAIIINWNEKQDYRNLALVNKIVNYAPLESFLYLTSATKQLVAKENEHLGSGGLMQTLAYTISPEDGDFNTDGNAINLGSIEPIITKLIYMLKNGVECNELEIKHILKYLTSTEVLNLPKPHYDNQTLESIFRTLVSPLKTTNFNVILLSLDIMKNWIDEEPIVPSKFNILVKVVQDLLGATFEDNHWDKFAYHMRKTSLNIQHPEVLKILHKTNEILFTILSSENPDVLYNGLDSINYIGGRDAGSLTPESQAFYSDMKKDLLRYILKILDEKQSLLILSKIEDVALRIIKFYNEKDEAFAILEKIPRSDEFVLYQMIKGVDFLITDYDTFYKESQEQGDIKSWMFDLKYRMDKNVFSEDEILAIQRLSENLLDIESVLDLLNNLDMNSWNAYSSLLQVINKWFEFNNKVLIEVCVKHLGAVTDRMTLSVLKEFSYVNGLIEITLEDIGVETSNEDLKVFINSLFQSYNFSKLSLISQIVEVVKNKTPSEIRMFIAIIAQKIYFTGRDNPELYNDFEEIMVQFLDWQLEYNFEIESYLTNHILEKYKSHSEIPSIIKDRLLDIIKKDEIEIDEYHLKSIYKLLDLGLEELLPNLYNKLTSKKDDGTYKHYFPHYFDHDKVVETLLIKEYINSYEDFLLVIEKTVYYYNNFKPVLKDDNGEDYIRHLDVAYFLEYAKNEEYIKKLFNDLNEANDIETISILFKIVPMSGAYIDVIINNINKLEDHIDERKLFEYLTRIGTLRMYSSAPMENSPELLSEEALLEQICDRVDSLSLQLKLKDELKYFILRKKQEVEQDIEHLLDKG